MAPVAVLLVSAESPPLVHRRPIESRRPRCTALRGRCLQRCATPASSSETPAAVAPCSASRALLAPPSGGRAARRTRRESSFFCLRLALAVKLLVVQRAVSPAAPRASASRSPCTRMHRHLEDLGPARSRAQSMITGGARRCRRTRPSRLHVNKMCDVAAAVEVPICIVRRRPEVDLHAAVKVLVMNATPRCRPDGARRPARRAGRRRSIRRPPTPGRIERSLFASLAALDMAKLRSS